MWRQPKIPLMDKWIKMWFVYTHTQEYYLALKKGNPVIFEMWMNLEGIIILSEISQMEKDKY